MQPEGACMIPVVTNDGVGDTIPEGARVRYLSYGVAPWGPEYAFFEVEAA